MTHGRTFWRAVLVAFLAMVCLWSIGRANATVAKADAQALAPESSAANERASGVAPLTSLADAAQPLAARSSGTGLILVARPRTSDGLVLERIQPNGVSTRTPLGIASIGYRLGLAVAPDGTAWIGVNSTLIRVTPQGTTEHWTIPASQSTPRYAPPAAPNGLPPFDDGQVTAAALDAHGAVLLGRAGKPELTVFTIATASFSRLALPSDLGDIEQFAGGPAGSILFTVNRSANQPGVLYDRVGLIDSSGGIHSLNVSARSVSGTTSLIVAAGVRGIGWFDGSGVPVHATLPVGRYDESRIAALANGGVAARAAGGSNRLVVIDPTGVEVRRFDYQVPILTFRDGTVGPYASAFVFLDIGSDGAVWFGLYGSPDIYRVLS